MSSFNDDYYDYVGLCYIIGVKPLPKKIAKTHFCDYIKKEQIDSMPLTQRSLRKVDNV